MSQLSFSSLTVKKKTIRSKKFLEEMQLVVPWRMIVSIIEPYYSNSRFGRKPMPLIQMLKIYCLQQWFNLSDPGAEEAIYDRLSFQNFLGIDLMIHPIPDETTILNFRHLLEENDLMEKIFYLINKELQKKGLFLKEGTIVDASIIPSSSSTKNKEKKRDPEMSSTRKNSSYHFGMKVHTGIDVKSGLVHTVKATKASISDKEMLYNLLLGKEKAVFGDKGYIGRKDKRMARDAGVFWGVLDKKSPKRKLSNKQEKRNTRLSKIRSKVEFPFQVVKHLWGHKKARYKGIKKNAQQFMMLFALSNIYKSRKVLLCT